MLEAYALGAVPADEGAHIEEHLADCLACWDHLSRSQRAAALLALAVPLEEPREGLRRRIIAEAQREAEPVAQSSPRRWRLPQFLAVGAAVVALSAVGTLSWSLVHVHNDVQQAVDVNTQQDAIMHHLTSIVTSPDVQKLAMETSGIAATAAAGAYYVWTSASKSGALVCQDMPPAPDGMVYQLWLSDGQTTVSGGTFTPVAGQCQHFVSLEDCAPISEVIVSLEPAGGSASPSSNTVLYASLTQP